MFGKKKKQPHSLLNSVDDSKTIVNSFCLRHSHEYGIESLRTVDYRSYHKLNESEMIPILEERFEKMAAGDVDDANGDMLNDIIFSAAFEAFADLKLQQSDHKDMIRRFIVCRKADREDILRVMQEREKEYDMLQNDFCKIDEMLSRYEEV